VVEHVRSKKLLPGGDFSMIMEGSVKRMSRGFSYKKEFKRI
jgi:hypothetical protein